MSKATKETLKQVTSRFVISDDPKKSFIAGYMIGVAEQAAKVVAEKNEHQEKQNITR